MSSVKLEDLIKTNLTNYEARYDAIDWSRMESMLGTTPDSSSFNWKPVWITLIILTLLGGGYVLFTTLDFSRPAEKPAVYTPPVVTKKPASPAKKNVPPPVITPSVAAEDSLKHVEEETTVAKAEDAKKEEEESRLKKERRKEEPTKEEMELRRARRRSLATSDSGKTGDASKETATHEKEPEKKEKAKSSSIGWNIFSTINADSLKKYQERLKKDSVK